MTPEQLGNVAASLKAALAIIEAAEENAAQTVTEVGGDGDPIRVRFEQRGTVVHGRVLHTDESLRNTGIFFTHKNGFALSSSQHPTLFADTLFVWGRLRADDARTMLCHRPTPHDATEYVTRACNAVAAFNAQWRAEKAKPTLEQDIETVQGFVETNGWGKASSKDVLEAFERIVAKVK